MSKFYKPVNLVNFMKLFLTSIGLENHKLIKPFQKLFTKSLAEAKVFVISTIKTKRNHYHLNLVKKGLMLAKIKKSNIKIFNVENKISYPKVREFDCIYFCGGNTFYLLNKIRQTGFDKIIKKFIKEPNKVYLGVSAGSIISGPNIEIAGWGSEGDPNEVALKNLNGLNLTNVAIFPHFKNKLKKEVIVFRKKVKYKVITLTDKQAISISGKTKKFIS